MEPKTKQKTFNLFLLIFHFTLSDSNKHAKFALTI